jgi:hypothetical protein
MIPAASPCALRWQGGGPGLVSGRRTSELYAIGIWGAAFWRMHWATIITLAVLMNPLQSDLRTVTVVRGLAYGR